LRKKKEAPETYCIATFCLKNKEQVTDNSAVLLRLDSEEIEIKSRRYSINKNVLESITIAIVDGRNSYLVINGPVLEMKLFKGEIIYTIASPKTKELSLPNGKIVNAECYAISKYANIHKAKRKKKEPNV